MAESPGKRRGREDDVSMKDPVDVLIIGAGASGAAVAWSLAETKMHILCLEQGGWTNPAEYPSTGRDWEARLYGDYSPSPNIRARPEDYPVNDDHSPIKVVNFNGVGGSTIMYTAHWPRLHPSDFRVRRCRRLLADRLRHAGAVFRAERSHDGSFRSGRRPRRASSARQMRPADAAIAARGGQTGVIDLRDDRAIGQPGHAVGDLLFVSVYGAVRFELLRGW